MERGPEEPTLGGFLRNEREKRGVTVEQVVSATKISLRLVHALENDQYMDLPAKAFVRGFVVSYCRFLGVSPQEVLSRFSKFLDDKAMERPAKDSGHSGYAFDRKEGDGGRTGLWILMGSMLLIGAIVVVLFKPSLRHHRKSSVQKLQEANVLPVAGVTPSPAPEASPPAAVPSGAPATPVADASPAPSASPEVSGPVPAVTPSAPSAPAPAPSSSPVVEAASVPEPVRSPDPMLSGKDLLKDEIRVKVVIQAVEDVWVRFKVDEKDKNRIILRQGVGLVLFAQKVAAFQVSDPAQVLVTRAVGEPRRLQLIHGQKPVSEILEEKKGVAADGRTILTAVAPGSEGGNPFEGDAPLGPPPAKVQRAAPTPTPESSELSTQ